MITSEELYKKAVRELNRCEAQISVLKMRVETLNKAITHYRLDKLKEGLSPLISIENAPQAKKQVQESGSLKILPSQTAVICLVCRDTGWVESFDGMRNEPCPNCGGNTAGYQKHLKSKENENGTGKTN